MSAKEDDLREEAFWSTMFCVALTETMRAMREIPQSESCTLDAFVASAATVTDAALIEWRKRWSQPK